MSARRRLSAMRRIVRPASSRRVISGRFSTSRKNSFSGIEIVPEGSRATAEAGNGRCSKTATAPTGSPGPRISRIRSLSGAALTIFTRPTKRKWMKCAASPSSKRVAPFS